jgi:sugar lactone lactonase YvrE
MLSSLTWAGYEVNHAWGTNGHDSKGGVSIMPEALKWLWKDHPGPVQVHIQPTNRLNLALAGEGWKAVPLDVKATHIAVDNNGSLFFSAGENIYKLQASGKPVLIGKMKGVGALAFDTRNIMYLYNRTDKTIYSASGDNKFVKVITNVVPSSIIVSPKGIYYSEPQRNRIGFYSFSKKSLRYSACGDGPQALAISPEQSFLNAGTTNGRFGYSYKIQGDGSLSDGQDYVHYHIPYGAASPGISGMTSDIENILYTSTSMGIQASDQLGRVNYIFSNPAAGVTGIALGGADFNTLYAVANGQLFNRKINAKGFIPGQTPIKPPRPGL